MQRCGSVQPHPQQQRVIAGHAEQAQPDHQHAGDRTATERHVHGGTEAMACGFGGAYVGPHRHVHADVAGRTGQHRTDREPDRGVPAEEDADQHEQHRAGDADGEVLAVEVGARAFLDGGGDFLHPGIARRLPEDPACRHDAVENRENGAEQRQRKPITFQHVPSRVMDGIQLTDEPHHAGHNGLQRWTNPFRPYPVIKRVALFSNPWCPRVCSEIIAPAQRLRRTAQRSPDPRRTRL